MELLIGNDPDRRADQRNRQRHDRAEGALRNSSAQVGGAGICGDPLCENAAQFRRDGGELIEFVVVRGIVGLHVGQVDHGRAQRRQLRRVGVIADSGNAAADGPGEPQRFVVLRKNDIERLLRLAEAPHLRLEHVDVDIGRRQEHIAELAHLIEVARDLDLPERLDGDPVAHGMGEHVDLFGVAGEQEAERMLKFVARRGGAVGVVDVGRRFSPRRPSEQHRDRRGFRVVGYLGQAIEPLGEHRIEAVDE